jgi:tetratricopeptide (TPR) repeat protein
VYNVWLLLSPSQLCAEYAMGTVPPVASLSDPRNLLTLATFAGLLSLSCYSASYSHSHHRKIMFGLCLTVLPFLPASNLFFPVGFVVAERVLYLPSMGFCMLVGFGAHRIFKSINSSALRGIFSFLIVGVLSVHSLKTGLRNLDWVSEHSIYASAVRINPNHGPMLTNLGAVYVMNKDLKNYTMAEILFKRCVDILPEYPRGLSNYAGLLEATKRRRQAEKVMRQAIEMGLQHTAMNQLENIYHLLRMFQRDTGREEDELELCDFALRHYPATAHLFFHRGKILKRMNRTSEAVSDLEIAVQTPIFLPDINHHLGLAYVAAGLPGKAERAFRAELAGNPGSIDSLLQLGVVLVTTGTGDHGRLREAQKYLQQVLSVQPRNKEAVFHQALAYYNLQNLQKSEELFLSLLQLSPTDKEGLYYLGLVYYKAQKYGKAVDVWKKLDRDYRDVATQLKLAEKHSK